MSHRRSSPRSDSLEGLPPQRPIRNPYENIFIGNFLVTLGLHIGTRCGLNAPPASVSLLQQTPMDKSIGDLMLEFPGVLKIIEFKRQENDSIKEASKMETLAAYLDAELASVSRSVHWYIETINEEKAFRSEAVPYLDFRLKRQPSVPTAWDLLKVIVDEVTDASRPHPAPELFKRYLAALAACAGSNVGSSGLIIYISGSQAGAQAEGEGSAGGGGGGGLIIRHMAIEDLRDLRLQYPQQILEMQLARELRHDLEIKQQIEHEHQRQAHRLRQKQEREYERERGPQLGRGI